MPAARKKKKVTVVLDGLQSSFFLVFFFHSTYVHCGYSYCIRKKGHVFVVVFDTYVTGFDALFPCWQKGDNDD